MHSWVSYTHTCNVTPFTVPRDIQWRRPVRQHSAHRTSIQQETTCNKHVFLQLKHVVCFFYEIFNLHSKSSVYLCSAIPTCIKRKASSSTTADYKALQYVDRQYPCKNVTSYFKTHLLHFAWLYMLHLDNNKVFLCAVVVQKLLKHIS